MQAHPTLYASILALLAAAAASAQQSARKIGYNRDIRPLLADNCFACHGPDKNNRKAKLRLDDREVALARKAIAPGQPEISALVERIFSADSDEVMPPPRSHKTLKAEQKELLKRWIAEGAAYEPYWAYIPPARRSTLSCCKSWIRETSLPLPRPIAARCCAG
jgi:mono/diheme cytochrome c family protein